MSLIFAPRSAQVESLMFYRLPWLGKGENCSLLMHTQTFLQTTPTLRKACYNKAYPFRPLAYVVNGLSNTETFVNSVRFAQRYFPRFSMIH